MNADERRLIEVVPVIDKPAMIRGLCVRPYPLHPKGCPNFSKRPSCPPQARLYDEVYDLSLPVYAVIHEFNLGAHVERMRLKHPTWSDRQLRCVLYWQRGARAELLNKIVDAMRDPRCVGYGPQACPEAMGVNVTKTLENVGIILEWPPVMIARQVALLASYKNPPDTEQIEDKTPDFFGGDWV